MQSGGGCLSLSTVPEYQNEPNSFFVELLSLYRLLCSALKAAQCLALCEFGVLFLLPADVCEVTAGLASEVSANRMWAAAAGIWGSFGTWDPAAHISAP